jgi:predicted ATPase/DNA-binding SARP family transcriptional activator/DNA-binding CsgD family transcriptional regulator
MSPQVLPDNCEDLRIQLLGRFHVCVGSRRIADAAWRRRKAAAIVKLLALAPQHRLHREQLMDLLWPGFEPRAAANNLRTTLHAARRILDSRPPDARPPPPDGEWPSVRYLQGDPLELCPAGTVWVDVHAFEGAAAAARQDPTPAAYQAALVLYTGDLLPEDRYEEWALHRRIALHGLYTSLLIDLARLYEAEGDLARAIETLQRVVVHKPTHEDAHVRLMRLYTRSGQRYQALQQYRQLEAALASGLDADPGPVAQRIHQELVEQRVSLSTPGSSMPSPPLSRHNLPAPVTTFVGREREIGEVRRLLGGTRLLTLTGPGGCGKTRLALEVAARLGETSPDGVWLIELAAVEDAGLVPQALAAALGIPEQPGRPLSETLCTALETKHLLLVLDNCEHLVDACATLTDTLLRACPRLSFLATSRQALGIAGEQVWRVPSLELPDVRDLTDVDEIAGSEAVRLFLDRARLSRPGFALREDNAASLVELCRRLDGMPLAIELAAARLRLLSVQQIAAHLDDRFALLTGGSRAALPRQRTLRATVEWSYDLLSEAEQTLFDRLSVFAGDWTLEAATEVCAGPEIPSGQVLDLVGSLVDQSLVQVEVEGTGATRYRLLETLRQYAQRRLAERSEVGSVTRRHAAYYLALAEAAEPELTGPEQAAWLDRLEVEHGNLRAALRGSLDSGQIETAARLSGALGLFWFARGHLSEGIRWLDVSLCGRSTLSLPSRAKGLLWAGALRLEHGDYVQGQAEIEESLSLCTALGDRHRVAINLNMLGCNLREQGHLERAMDLLERGLLEAREAGDSNLIGLSLTNLGDVARYQGDYARAAPMYRESLALFRKAGDMRRAAFALTNLAYIANQQGDSEQARALYLEGLEQGQRVGDRHRLAVCLEGLADVALGWGEPTVAARLLGAAEGLRKALGAPLSVVQRAVYDRFTELAGSATGNIAYRTAWAEGRALTLEQAIDYAQMVRRSKPPGARLPGELPPEGQAAPLTARETEVAALVARGLTNREIAKTLVIAEGTAANHVHHILTKLGLDSRKEIAAWAVACGLLYESSPLTGPPP